VKEILELISKLTDKYPTLRLPIVLLICALIVLVWEVLKTLAPKAVSFLVGIIRKRYTSSRGRTAQEKAVREFTARMQTPNWLSCIRSIAKYHANVPLITIYHPLRFQFFGEQREYTSTIERILTNNNVFSIVGPPGSGKSTVMSMLAVAYAEDAVEQRLGIKESRLPLFFPLRNLPPELRSISRILTKHFQESGCPIDSKFIQDQLQNGRCTILLDGLDETGDISRRREVVQWIVKTISAFPNNRYIVSCRSIEWDLVSIPNMPYAHILDLSSEDIAKIINNWEQGFSESTKDGPNSKRARRISLSDTIQKTGNKDLRILAKNPLLLTIMTILHLNGIKIPSRKVEVYNVFVRTLLSEWDEVKGIVSAKAESEIDKRLKFLQRLSLFILMNGSLSETIDIRLDDVASFVEKQSKDLFGNELRIREFLDSAMQRSGLLYSAGEDRYIFSSRAFLEFLAARELKDRADYDTVINHIAEEEWFETIIQFGGLLPDASELADRITSAKKTFAEVSEQSELSYRVLAHLLVDAALDSDKARERIWSLLRDYVIASISSERFNIDLIRDIYATNTQYWREWLYSELVHSNSSANSRHACEILASIDDTEALRRLSEASRSVSQSLKVEIAKSLRHSPLSESIDILWELIASTEESSEIYNAVIDSLSSKGDAVIPSCKRYLDLLTSPELNKKAAIAVLCRIDNPLIIPYLIEIRNTVSPQVYHHIVRELHGTYLSQYHLEDADKILQRATSPNSVYATYFKRPADLLLSFISLVFFAPIILLIWILIILDSAGPALYRQIRVGKDGRHFTIFKFRTSLIDTEAFGPVWASSSDARITRVGKILRKLSIDELPSFINILKGDMSYVGPRPERPHFVEQVTAEIPLYSTRINVRPGITGLAQIKYVYGASIEDLRQRLVYDLFYASKCSLLLDLSIILRGIGRVLFGRGSV